MPNETSPRHQTPPLRPLPDAPLADTGSYLDWPAILAGGVFALALVFLLISFGGTIGLSLSSPYRGEGVSAGWLATAAAIWFAWVMVTGFGAGGYLAGRMRRRAGDATAPEVEVRDGTHGLMVWATAVVVSSVFAAMGAGGLIGLGASTAGTVAEAAAEGVEAEYLANVLLRGPDGAVSIPEPATQQQIAMVLARSLADGELAEPDRGYLGTVVAASTGLDQEVALDRVDAAEAEIAALRARAVAAVERARVAGVVFGFIAAATLLLGAIAAFLASVAGGRHRDGGLGVDPFVRRA